MNALRLTLPLAALSFAAVASAQAPVYGVLETYFRMNRLTPGAIHQMTWGEFNYRPVSNLKLTYSFTVMPEDHTLDETCAAWDGPNVLVRAGRIRTSFGFSDWSDLRYTGFNHVPLIRSQRISDATSLNRDDSGVEVTTNVGTVQIQAAALDTSIAIEQITPDNIDTGMLRLQAPVGPFIVGLDSLRSLRHEQGVYGFDLRYTTPHLTSRAEYFSGNGKTSAQGYYADIQYRLPGLPRTQLVGMTEWFDKKTSDKRTMLHTVGLRQVVTPNFTLNVNYGWGGGLDNVASIRMQGLDNWSARALFQIQF